MKKQQDHLRVDTFGSMFDKSESCNIISIKRDSKLWLP